MKPYWVIARAPHYAREYLLPTWDSKENQQRGWEFHAYGPFTTQVAVRQWMNRTGIFHVVVTQNEPLDTTIRFAIKEN